MKYDLMICIKIKRKSVGYLYFNQLIPFIAPPNWNPES
jgi:hypothetical protein